MGRVGVVFLLALSVLLADAAISYGTTVVDFPITTSGTHRPRFLTTGIDGKIWYTDGGTDRVSTIGLDGTQQTDVPRPARLTGTPFDIAVGPDAVTYWSQPSTNVVSSHPGGSLTIIATNPGSGPLNESNAIAIDQNGAARFGNTREISPGQYVQAICSYLWNSPFTSFCQDIATTTSNVRITGLELGADNTLWATLYEADRLVQQTPSGLQTFQLAQGARPYRLAKGPDGSIWVAEYGTNTLERFTTTGNRTVFPLPAGAYPNDITAGPDGNMWFVEWAGNNVSCITPAGKISRYPIPTAKAFPWGIALGPDRALWFSESDKAKIGKVKPDTPCGADANSAVVSPGSASDKTAPSFIRKLALSPSKFRVGPRSTALSAKRAPAGSKFKYALSEPATVKIAIQKPGKGRRVRGKCRKQTKGNRKRRKCTLYKTVGTFTRKATQGDAQTAFSGRIGRKKLQRGSYRAVAIATDAAKNKSKASNASFKIVR